MTETDLFPIDGLERTFHPWIPHSKQAQRPQESTEAHPVRSRSTYASGRKQACSRCAKRRRKCDSQLPSCSTCRKASARCLYPAVTSSSSAPISDDQPGSTTQIIDQDGEASKDSSLNRENVLLPERSTSSLPSNGVWPNIDADPLSEFGVDDTFFSQPYMWPTVPFIFDSWIPQNDHNTNEFAPEATEQNHSSSVAPGVLPSLAADDLDGGLPDSGTTKELLDIFFRDYHKYLPCLHRKSIFALIENDNAIHTRSSLLLALFAIASKTHRSQDVQSRRQEWLRQAKRLWHGSIASADNPTRHIQAAVWILFAEYTGASINESWLFLGTAIRYASLIGADRIDGVFAQNLPESLVSLRGPVDIEERRRSVWALAVLDKKLSSLCGMPLAIDDRMFNVNFPLHEDVFQNGDADKSLRRFTVDLNSLIGPATFCSEPLPSTYELVLRATTLLGQISLYHGIQQAGQSIGERSEESVRLEGALTRFSLALSRFDVATVGLEELDYAVWLHVTVQTSIILFYHPKVAQCMLTGTRGIPNPPSKLPPSLKKATDAIENLVLLVKSTIPRSTEALLNPFFLGIFFLCCRYKIFMWRAYHTPKDRDDLDMMIMLVDQLTMKWGPLGLRFQEKIRRDLKIVEEEVQDDRNS